MPLLLLTGVRRLTMRQAASAACLSVGGLYHYFPTKQKLVLFGVQPGAAAHLCAAFHAQHGWLKAADPSRFLAAWVDFVVDGVAFARPAIQAALELGHATFWSTLEYGINAGLDDLGETLNLIVPTSDAERLQLLARSLRRSLFAAYIDRTLAIQILREELLAALAGYSPDTAGKIALIGPPSVMSPTTRVRQLGETSPT
ncbi:MAG: TetR/AcrR family transcriptional regulator; helix-turn-helix transcriptional regulator [Chloroflexi bacterium]|nr:TetR/AcrR family transcriptional regulator; helix-turn-helix transcriptional regulator [Chloroflexota bacterium]